LELATAARASSSPPGLLPTPQAHDSAGAKTPEQVAAMRDRGHGVMNLNEVIPQLLKTPTAQLAVNGGSQHPDKRKAGGHGPTLADQVEHLLPTPAAHDTGNTPENHLRKKPGRSQVTSLQVIVDYGLLATGGRMSSPSAGMSEHSDDLLLFPRNPDEAGSPA
jgi:hypothetical protein